MLFLRPINNQQMTMVMDMFIVESLNCRRLCPALSWQFLDAVSPAGPWHFQPGSLGYLKGHPGIPVGLEGSRGVPSASFCFPPQCFQQPLDCGHCTSRFGIPFPWSLCADSFYFLFFHQFSLSDNISEWTSFPATARYFYGSILPQALKSKITVVPTHVSKK